MDEAKHVVEEAIRGLYGSKSDRLGTFKDSNP